MKKLNKLPSDIFLMLVWTILTVIFVFMPFLSDTVVRTLLGIPMVLFVPGYALIAALFPKKDDLESIERIALSFGLSIAVVPLLGLLLNFTVGIRLTSILMTLCAYTLVMILIAAYRREKLSEKEQFTISFQKIFGNITKEIKFSGSKTNRILTGILFISIVLAAGMIILVIATPKTGERFTEFYILDPSGKAQDYQTNLKYNTPAEILVGVANHEFASVNYTIQVSLNSDILTDTSFRLDHNETKEKNMTFIPDKEGTDMKLEFLLFKENNFSVPYRELHLWVNVTI